MTQIIKISKPGFNVLTETDPDNLVFTSDFGTLKYLAAVITTVVGITVNPMDEATVDYSISHGLDYVPYFVAYAKNTEDADVRPYVSTSQGGGVSGVIFASIFCDSSNINIFLFGINANLFQISETFTVYTKIYKNDLGF